MKRILENEECPKCKERTLCIKKSDFHHIERCSKCLYVYEEYLSGYEDYLHKEFRN